MAAHLKTVSGLLTSCLLDEYDIDHADETHFVISVDSGRTMGFSGSNVLKYANVVSCVEGFTMAVCLCGARDLSIQLPMMDTLTKIGITPFLELQIILKW